MGSSPVALVSALSEREREPLAALSEFKEIRYGFLPTRKLSEVVRVCGEMRRQVNVRAGKRVKKYTF